MDETREAERISMWDDPEAFVNSVQRSYRRNRWADQPTQVEVWSEKGTVRGTLAPILNKYGVTFGVMHGYGSATVIDDIAGETGGAASPLLVLYVGDWDPSGMHMSAVDLPERLERYGASVDIERIALTADHIANDGLPSFDAGTKCRDPRYSWFAHQYGGVCWQLDALSPVTLREAVEERILRIIDKEDWDRCEKVEAAERLSMVSIMRDWKTAMRMQP